MGTPLERATSGERADFNKLCIAANNHISSCAYVLCLAHTHVVILNSGHVRKQQRHFDNTMKRKQEIDVDEHLRGQRIEANHQLALYALQRRSLDLDALATSAAITQVQELAESLAEARDRAHRGDDSHPDCSSSTPPVAVGAIAARLAEAEEGLQAAFERADAGSSSVRAVLDRQMTDRLRMANLHSAELKGMKFTVPFEGAPDSSADAAAADAAASAPAGAGGAATAGPAKASSAFAGLHVCHRCTWHFPRSEGTTCSECHRELCGRGPRRTSAPLAWPCVEVYRCNCGNVLCHDCYTGAEQRGCASWLNCARCASWMCGREVRVLRSECGACGLEPICRGCRPMHDRECDAGGRDGRRRDSDEEDDDEEGDEGDDGGDNGSDEEDGDDA